MNLLCGITDELAAGGGDACKVGFERSGVRENVSAAAEYNTPANTSISSSTEAVLVKLSPKLQGMFTKGVGDMIDDLITSAGP